MKRWRMHPSWRDLNRFADGEASGAACASTADHVSSCARCRRQVAYLHELREAGRDMRHPSPPRDLLPDILRDRAAGARVILPAAPPAPARARRLLPAAAAAAVIMTLAALATVTLTSEAGAGASVLTVDPATPEPGETVTLSYRPGTILAGESVLKVRLSLRRADDEPPRAALSGTEEVLLRPDAGGRFTASFRLPADFAFGSMAVESLSGDRLDDRGGRLWEVRAHASDGQPLPGALRQEFLVLQHRSWPDAREVLHEMTVLYPTLAEGWSLMLAYDDLSSEGPATLSEEEASRRAVHREIFRGLQARLGSGDLPLEEVAAMVRYAAALGDQAVFDRWLARLEALEPAHRVVLSYRLAALGADAGAADAYLERLWSDGWQSPAIATEAFQRAHRSGSADAARRWALRGLAAVEQHEDARDMALSLVAHPDTRERGLVAIRDLLEHLGEEVEAERPLDATPAESRAGARRLEAELRIRLGEQLLAAGSLADANREFDRAFELGEWIPALYRGRLEARLALGDTLVAVADFHRLAVDPIYSRESVDSLRQRLPVMTPADQTAGRIEAEAELVERVRMAQDLRRGLPSVRLRTSTGQTRSLESLVAGRPTVLLLWDRRVFGDPDDVTSVIRARNLLAGGPGQLLWVTAEPESEALQAFRRARGLILPAYHDPESELATELGEWGKRGYFVIDGTGTIRVRTHSLMEAVRHLEILQMGARGTA